MIVYIPHISRKPVLVDREVIENSIFGIYIGECYDTVIVVDIWHYQILYRRWTQLKSYRRAVELSRHSENLCSRNRCRRSETRHTGEHEMKRNGH